MIIKQAGNVIKKQDYNIIGLHFKAHFYLQNVIDKNAIESDGVVSPLG